MGEQASKIGKKLEGFGEKLFTDLGWKELARDTEIKCNRSLHKKRTHGLDLLMSFPNPYMGSKQGIVVECKNWQMSSISQKNIDKWLIELIAAVECAQSAPELSAVDMTNTNLCTGLLLVHANDSFDSVKFKQYLSNIKVPSRRNPINIFIAGNDEINKWNALLDKIEKDHNEEFRFMYPSIEGSNLVLEKFLTINQLYSKFIFAQSIAYREKETSGFKHNVPILRKILFSFDEITTDSFKYIWSMFKFYQLQDAEELVFIFYPQKKNDKEFVNDNFITTLYQVNPPITEDIEKRIKIDFIDNRNLSPVDVGRD